MQQTSGVLCSFSYSEPGIPVLERIIHTSNMRVVIVKPAFYYHALASVQASLFQYHFSLMFSVDFTMVFLPWFHQSFSGFL